MAFRALVAGASALTVATVFAPAASVAASTLTIPQQTALALRVLDAHNQVRTGAGVQPVQWDSQLAAGASAYADELARTGRWAHSPAASRPGQGENLWMGTHGAFTLERMIGDWASEGRMFRRGAFPRVSSTGDWEDVGHYTQMIWPASTRIGCALSSSARYDYLVCRYSPAGNVMGAPVP